jgi:small subunit ribosomal protein S1
MANVYKPEGVLLEAGGGDWSDGRGMFVLREALEQKKILEARAKVCDAAHNLIVDLGPLKGIIPREEAAIGIEDGTTRDIAIISRVSKPVCFFVREIRDDAEGGPCAVLSRRRAQEECRREYIERLKPGDVIDARVTHLEPFGCFVDIGCGIASLIPIDAISVSRISHPRDRFKIGQDIKAVVKSLEPDGRVTLSHKELLGTWNENAAAFEAGETVAGIVRSVEPYGIFVELAPNLAGLAEPREGVTAGQHAGVYIKSLIPDKMKVKLIVVDSFDAAYIPPQPRYYFAGEHMDVWRYSPENSERVIETRFASE